MQLSFAEARWVMVSCHLYKPPFSLHPIAVPISQAYNLFTLRSSCRTVYFISTIISGDDGQGVIGHPCRTSHNFTSRSTTPIHSRNSASNWYCCIAFSGDLVLQADVLSQGFTCYPLSFSCCLWKCRTRTSPLLPKSSVQTFTLHSHYAIYPCTKLRNAHEKRVSREPSLFLNLHGRDIFFSFTLIW